jgi:hypothetical protein
MSKMRFLVALSLILGLCAATLRAEPPEDGGAADASLEALVSAVRSNRKALVAVNLELTDDEAARFWPAYDRYQKDLNAVGDRLVAVIRDYSASFPGLSDDEAMQLVERHLAVEADRIAIRRKHMAEFRGLLPGRKVGRLYQIENKMDAVLRYDLAATIPVIEE